MGAKQSKRSVDISGKEAESAGEVAASIAGGEGRLEQLADADALKPQLNGDAHIHDTVMYTHGLTDMPHSTYAGLTGYNSPSLQILRHYDLFTFGGMNKGIH